MPIKRRSAFHDRPKPDETVNAKERRPQKVYVARSPVKVGLDHVKVNRRWPRSDAVHVFLDGDILSIRTPKECTRWNHEFRTRIIRDYHPPNTLVDKQALDRLYDPATVYDIGGRPMMFRQPTEQLDTKNRVVILRTEVIDVTDKKAMSLQHPDPAMRVMMVYAFMQRMSFDGVASFSVYDWQP